MKACKTPCSECPFRKNSLAGWLAEYTPTQLHQIVMSEQPFPCHKTHQEDVSFEDAKKLPLCNGALAYMKKNGKSPRDRDLNEFVKAINEDVLENILSVPEFFEHHELTAKNSQQSKRPIIAIGVRTKDEIIRQIEGLKTMRSTLPEYSFFGDPNWAGIDAQIEILEGGDLEDFEQGDIDEMDEEYKIYTEAENAVAWLDDKNNEDMFDSE